MSSQANSKGVAFITGAAQGIGRAIAVRLANDGFRIAVNDLEARASQLNELSSQLAIEPLIVIGDVSNDSEVSDMIDKVVGALGGLDVMVANAGIMLAKPLLETSADEWDRVLDVNARGIFLCYKYAAKQMIAQGRGGRIIGASSVVGKQGEADIGVYSASKFAVRGLTQAAAKEWGVHKITVNAYAPGSIETDFLDSMGRMLGLDNLIETEAKRSAVQRNGSPEEIASIVSYLASPESGFITGQSISVNGGRFCD